MRFVMVVGARLAYIRSKVEDGHQMHIAWSFSAASNLDKVKFIICRVSHVVPKTSQFATLRILDTVVSLAANAVTMDRGHKHSDGCCEVCLWMTPLVSSVSFGRESAASEFDRALEPRGSDVDPHVSTPLAPPQLIVAAVASTFGSRAIASPFATAEDDPHALEDSAWLNVQASNRVASTSCPMATTSCPLACPPASTAMPAPAPPIIVESTSVLLIVIDERNEETVFKIGKTAPLSKLMDAYCARRGLRRSQVDFRDADDRIKPHSTADELGMIDNDPIVVVFLQEPPKRQKLGT